MTPSPEEAGTSGRQPSEEAGTSGGGTSGGGQAALRPLPPEWYARRAEAVARDLLGRYLVRTMPEGARLVARLVETEAYQGEGDRASHAWQGPKTVRSRRLFRDGGHAYVYLIYGLHHCLNAVASSKEDGHAVLLRAAEPVEGEERMAALRGMAGRKRRPGDVGGGPGKLCQALAIDGSFDGVPLWEGELLITRGEPVPDEHVATGGRIGVDYAEEAAEWPLRFAIKGHPHMSRPRL